MVADKPQSSPISAPRSNLAGQSNIPRRSNTYENAYVLGGRRTSVHHEHRWSVEDAVSGSHGVPPLPPRASSAILRRRSGVPLPRELPTISWTQDRSPITTGTLPPSSGEGENQSPSLESAMPDTNTSEGSRVRYDPPATTSNSSERDAGNLYSSPQSAPPGMTTSEGSQEHQDSGAVTSESSRNKSPLLSSFNVEERRSSCRTVEN